jgi:hypothetical protein
MDYGYRNCNGTLCDLNYLRHVGWQESDYCTRKYYSKETIDTISKKITELTRGVDPQNRKIIVPPERICEVLDAVYINYRPPTGDIYSRYIIPNDDQANAVQSMIDQTIEIITDHIRNEMGMEENNQKLSAWVQVYGDFNTNQLRAHPIIKTRERRPSTMQYNMNY